MNTRRDFIYIDDLISVVKKSVYGGGQLGYYHISSGSDYSIKELFDSTLEALAITLEEDVEVRERSADDVFTILIDPSRTNNDFDWSVSTPLREGIQKTVEWYAEFGITNTYTHLKPVAEG